MKKNPYSVFSRLLSGESVGEATVKTATAYLTDYIALATVTVLIIRRYFL